MPPDQNAQRANRVETISLVEAVRAVLNQLEADWGGARVPYASLAQALRFDTGTVSKAGCDDLLDALNSQEDAIEAALWLEHNTVPEQFLPQIRRMLGEVAQAEWRPVGHRFLAAVALWGHGTTSGKRASKALLRQLLVDEELSNRFQVAIRLVERRELREALGTDITNVLVHVLDSDLPLDAKKDASAALADFGAQADHARDRLVKIAQAESGSRSSRLIATHALMTIRGSDDPSVAKIVAKVLDRYPDDSGMLFASLVAETALDTSSKKGKARNCRSSKAPQRGKQGVSDGHDGWPLILPLRESLVNHNQFSTLLNSSALGTTKGTEAALAYLQKCTAQALREPQEHLKQYLRKLNRAMKAKEKGERHFGSFEANQSFANSLRDQLYMVQLRLRCPTCGCPSMIVCFNSQRGLTGFFRFDHYLEGKKVPHGVSKDLAELVAVSPAPDQRRTS